MAASCGTGNGINHLGVNILNSLRNEGRGGERLEGVTGSESPFFDAETIADVIIADKFVKMMPKTFA
ncbi:hypothetical protein llap_6704 [Limosa lapponica baueri]|uniref:Uncharacterized protein n=1 Tax=Limosa lapponica baueri TaxID=1758121 RepID=A0A2I0UAH0_LIMLA|nr:hypothetical protein llap_6704 [Limosa lapponica baueri]